MASLKILGAAYGPANVTREVFDKVSSNSLQFKVSDLEDTWPGKHKSLVISYQYTGQPVKLEIVPDSGTCSIHPPPGSSKQSSKVVDILPAHWNGEIASTVGRRSLQSAANQSNITILGAAWGLDNVTSQAQEKIVDKKKFDSIASNAAWGKDGWPGKTKTLVVIYKYDGAVPMVQIVIENGTMTFVASPPMYVLGAAYGLADITNQVQGMIQNRQLNLIPVHAFKDSWPGHNKSFVLVYQYGNQMPKLAIYNENDSVGILYSSTCEYNDFTNPARLTIISAVYGLKDVTTIVKSKVDKEDTCLNNLAVNNSTFTDGWPGNRKTLVVVYQYGRDIPSLTITQEDGSLSIAKKFTPFNSLLDPRNMLHTGDTVAFLASNYQYVTCDSQNKLVASGTSPGGNCQLQVAVFPEEGGQESFTIMSKTTSMYVVIDSDNSLSMTGNSSMAAKFTLSLSTSGEFRLASKDTKQYVRLTQDLHLKADSSDFYGASTSFQLAVDTQNLNLLYHDVKLESLSDCDKAWLAFIWQLTGGFFSALGLGPFISTGAPNPGLLALLRSNSTVWTATQRLQQTLLASTSVASRVLAGVSIFSVLYHEGFLWGVIKFFLKLGGWYLVTKVLAKVIQTVFLPEGEAALLLASFTVWAIQLTKSSLDLQSICS